MGSEVPHSGPLAIKNPRNVQVTDPDESKVCFERTESTKTSHESRMGFETINQDSLKSRFQGT